MALTVKQIIAAKKPGITDDSRLDALIELASDRTSSDVFGKNANLAIALRVLHNIAISDDFDGQPGGVQSRSEGQLSITYANASAIGDKGDLSQTAWGVELRALIRANSSGPIHRQMNR